MGAWSVVTGPGLRHERRDLFEMTRDPKSSARRSSRLILASASPRRISLMCEHGYAVEVIKPPLEEPAALHPNLTPAEQAEALSYFKAESAATVVTDGVILAGDTIVSLDDRIFGKPANRNDARAILSALAGTTHHVITGVTLLNASNSERLIRHDTTAVIMRPISADELEAYLDTGAWSGKAGAYGIQDRGDAFIERIDGSFTNVVGFPMELVGHMLSKWGIHPSRES